MGAQSMYDITREYYRLPVALSVGGVVIDPTSLPIEFALMTTGTKPTDPDWVAGDWETVDDVHYARVLVGDADADIEIIAGTLYDVFWRITDTPERPVRLVGQVKAQ